MPLPELELRFVRRKSRKIAPVRPAADGAHPPPSSATAVVMITDERADN
jgi:hypothetical protein